MKYITDLFDTLWNDELEDRSDDVSAEKQRLAKCRLEQQKDSLTKDNNKKASHTTKT